LFAAGLLPCNAWATCDVKSDSFSLAVVLGEEAGAGLGGLSPPFGSRPRCRSLTVFETAVKSVVSCLGSILRISGLADWVGFVWLSAGFAISGFRSGDGGGLLSGFSGSLASTGGFGLTCGRGSAFGSGSGSGGATDFVSVLSAGGFRSGISGLGGTNRDSVLASDFGAGSLSGGGRVSGFAASFSVGFTDVGSAFAGGNCGLLSASGCAVCGLGSGGSSSVGGSDVGTGSSGCFCGSAFGASCAAGGGLAFSPMVTSSTDTGSSSRTGL
jgi:hypothetical protein